MRLERYLAPRLLRGEKNTFSRPVIRIAILSVALGLACMLLSVAIVTGFQDAIREKVSGFGAHVQITRFDNNHSYEMQPVTRDQSLIDQLTLVQGIRHVQVFATKAGIIKTDAQIEGVVFKGVGSDYDWSFLNQRLVEGNPMVVTEDSTVMKVLISRETASRLFLKTGDAMRMFFIQEGIKIPLGRKFTVGGIYETGLVELDRMYVFGDIKVIRKLQGWSDDQVGGLEVYTTGFGALDAVSKKIYNTIGYELNALSISERYPQMFEWLKLMDMNVLVILILMIIVSSMAMISTFLIIVLERTSMVGILKALGTTNAQIRRLFFIQASYILIQGLFWGNLLGIGLALLQKYTGWITLSQDSYYMKVVPVMIQVGPILALNAGTMFICLVLMVLPSYTLTRISPMKIILFR